MSTARKTPIIAMLTIALFAAIAAPACPQAKTQRHAYSDAAWMKDFAAPCSDSTCTGGRENALNWDPRFDALLKTSFPQRQWFWYEHGRLVSTTDLIKTFIGVPGDALLDDDRYVTADGSVPHFGPARGMLWIDTGIHPAALIFVGIDSVFGDNSADTYHLWVFSSTKLNWSKLPKPFLTSLSRWLTIVGKQGYKGTSGYQYKFLLATIVQPSGVMEDISAETLHLGTIATGATK